jgi:asparagine synthase (glutamine-hydrolysing)
MCGVAGYFSEQRGGDVNLMRQMLETINHRGPDGEGVLSFGELVLGHKRLSIIDLSQAGHQPMSSANLRYSITYNGEIYNFLELRKSMENSGYSFKGHSDSEVLVACLQSWGVKRTLQKIEGMYAFAIWDAEEKSLTLVRDRMGEKPLYYGFNGGEFVFASELRPIEIFCRNLSIDRDNLSLLFRHNYIPCPYSIYQGIKKLRPGCSISISKKDLQSSTLPEQEAYWRLSDVVGVSHSMSDEEASGHLEKLIKKSVERQMVSDVPIGCFLSGGVDSSLTTAIMQSMSNKPVNSFSIGFDVAELNEALYAKEVAGHIGTDHHEFYVSGSDCLNIVDKIPQIYDEPFSDSSQIPTFLVAQLARKEVTVCLSGDGGDELFGGYNRYFLADQYWNRIRHIPGFLKSSANFVATNTPPAILNGVYKALSPFLPSNLQFETPSDKLKKATAAISGNSFLEFYKSLVSHHKNPSVIVLGASEPKTLIDEKIPSSLNPIEQMMYLDALTYLPEDILTKVDRAAMAVSLETRIPLLDKSVVEFAWSLPFDFKVREGRGKDILRKVLYKYVPAELIERPKRGFGVPLDQWIRQELRGVAQDLLSVERVREQGYLDPEFVSGILNEHLNEKRNWQYLIWDILVFQLWLEARK